MVGSSTTWRGVVAVEVLDEYVTDGDSDAADVLPDHGQGWVDEVGEREVVEAY